MPLHPDPKVFKFDLHSLNGLNCSGAIDVLIPSYKSTYKVIADGRLYFYSAPDKECKIKGLFIIKNDIVDAYKIDGDFIFVMFFTKDNKSVEGWVDIRGVAATGSGVGPANN